MCCRDFFAILFENRYFLKHTLKAVTDLDHFCFSDDDLLTFFSNSVNIVYSENVHEINIPGKWESADNVDVI